MIDVIKTRSSDDTGSRLWIWMAVAVFFLSCPSLCQAEVKVKLSNGNTMTFESVQAKAGRLECQLKEGTIFLTPDQLTEQEKTRYFGELISTPSPVSSSSSSRVRTAAPSRIEPAASAKPPALDPAPVRPSPRSTNTSESASISPMKQSGGFFYSFSQPPAIHRKNPDVDYNYVLSNEKFFLYVPKNYDGSKPFGLVAFIGSRDAVEIPWGWDSVLREKNLLFVSPQNIGDNDADGRRVGLTVVAILKMMEEYKIDPSRVYVAGYGEGGRMAMRLAFQHPELVRGGIACSGAEFYKSVKWGGSGYGVFSHMPNMISSAKRNIRFVMITGETDIHRDEILDIYYGGYVKDGFQAKLFDVPSSPQGTFSANVLGHAIAFVDSGRKTER